MVGILDDLRLRIEHLEETVVKNEARHAKELADQAALHKQCIDSLLAVIESLSPREPSVDDSNRPFTVTEPIAKVVPSQPDLSYDEPTDLDSAAPETTNSTTENSVGGVSLGESGTLSYAGVASVESSCGQSASGFFDLDQKDNGFLPPRRKGGRVDSARTSRNEGDNLRDRHPPSRPWSATGSGPRRSRSDMSTSAGKLCGAKRIQWKSLYLAGISLDCTAEDIVEYSKKRKLSVV